jgi:hypothetical protein
MKIHSTDFLFRIGLLSDNVKKRNGGAPFTLAVLWDRAFPGTLTSETGSSNCFPVKSDSLGALQSFAVACQARNYCFLIARLVHPPSAEIG